MDSARRRRTLQSFTRPEQTMNMPLAGLLLAASVFAHAQPVLPDFDAATFLPMAPVTHPYFPLLDGLTRIFESDDGAERFELTVTGAGPTILGVATTVRRDRAFEEGLLVEDTFDFFAQDTAGNVWYFGEDVTNYVYDDEGHLVSTNTGSSWRAGVHDAKPGFIMPAAAASKIGFNHYQEFAPEDEALDQATIHALLPTFEAGLQTYGNVLRVLETTEVEPDDRGFKYYAPGIGLIAEAEGLNPALQNPERTFALVKVVPEPSSAMLMSLGALVVGAAGVARTRRRAAAQR
jgi:hypothetical protein